MRQIKPLNGCGRGEEHGLHTAFTDRAWWQGLYWVSYPQGAGHVSADGEATLVVSADRERFREVAHLNVPGDNRDQNSCRWAGIAWP